MSSTPVLDAASTSIKSTFLPSLISLQLLHFPQGSGLINGFAIHTPSKDTGDGGLTNPLGFLKTNRHDVVSCYLKSLEGLEIYDLGPLKRQSS